MIGRGLAGVLLLGSATACTAPSTNEAAAAPGLAVTLYSEDAIDGRRPQLILSCGPGGNSVMLDLPYSAPAAGAGTFKLDEAAPFQVPLMPMGDGHWAPRLEYGEETRLARSMAAAQRIFFNGPTGQTDRVVRWDLVRLGPRLVELRTACFSPAPP